MDQNKIGQCFLNSVLGAAVAVVISNIALAIIFFGTGNYYNHGIIGVYYALLTLLGVFVITGVVTSVISKKEQTANFESGLGEE